MMKVICLPVAAEAILPPENTETDTGPTFSAR